MKESFTAAIDALEKHLKVSCSSSALAARGIAGGAGRLEEQDPLLMLEYGSQTESGAPESVSSSDDTTDLLDLQILLNRVLGSWAQDSDM